MIREHFTSDFRRLLIDDPDTYEQALTYLEGTEADLADKVKLYEDELDRKPSGEGPLGDAGMPRDVSPRFTTVLGLVEASVLL